MIGRDQILKLKSDRLVFVPVEGEGILLDVKNNCYYELNETAARVLRILEGGETVDGILEDLEKRFDGHGDLKRDLEGFLDKLMELGFIEVREDGGSGRRRADMIQEDGKTFYEAPEIKPREQILVAFGRLSTHIQPIVKPKPVQP